MHFSLSWLGRRHRMDIYWSFWSYGSKIHSHGRTVSFCLGSIAHGFTGSISEIVVHFLLPNAMLARDRCRSWWLPSFQTNEWWQIQWIFYTGGLGSIQIYVRTKRHVHIYAKYINRFIVIKLQLIIICFPGALTSSIDLYRANLPYFGTPPPSILANEGADGLFVLGQLDQYISHSSCILLSQLYPKMHVEVVPNVNHYLQQNDPVYVNALIKKFLGEPTDYAVELLRHDQDE